MSTENVWVKYLSKKYKDIPAKYAGPVITISREFGCNTIPFAQKLSDKINSAYLKAEQNKWYCISKEILEKSAEELKINPEKISYIFEGKEKGFFNDLASSFGKKYYLSDSLILQTIKSVIKSYAWMGNVIIVGMASAINAQEIANALHLKLIAPLNYRVNTVAARLNLSFKEAKDLIIETDKKRAAFTKYFITREPELYYYDAVINIANFEENTMIDLIINLAKYKGLI